MAQADAGGAGGGLGDQIRIQFHGDDARVEEVIEVGLQLELQRRGRDRNLFFRRQQLAIQILGDGDEMTGRVAGGRSVAGQGRFGRAEQCDRVRGHRGRAQALQQPRGSRPAVHRLAQVAPQRVRAIGGQGNRLQFAAGLAEIQFRIFHLGQARIAAFHSFQERRLQRGRPARQAQQLDAAHRLDQARIQRGVMGDVGRQVHRVHADVSRPPHPAGATWVAGFSRKLRRRPAWPPSRLTSLPQGRWRGLRRISGVRICRPGVCSAP